MDSQQSHYPMLGCVSLGKLLNLSDLRLLIGKTGMLPAFLPAPLFSKYPPTPTTCEVLCEVLRTQQSALKGVWRQM